MGEGEHAHPSHGRAPAGNEQVRTRAFNLLGLELRQVGRLFAARLSGIQLAALEFYALSVHRD